MHEMQDFNTDERTQLFYHGSKAAVELEMDAHRDATQDTHREVYRKKLGRNSQCPCDSGKKYKKCCLPKSRYVG